MDSAGRSRLALILFLVTAPLAIAQDRFERGMELARASRYEEAKQELEAGWKEFPNDKRYPTELAGIAYRAGDTEEAHRYLNAARKLDRNDPYLNEFLGTLFFFDNNVEAAIKYWNRVDRPRTRNVTVAPEPKGDPRVADRTLAFGPGETLTLKQYRDTLAWVDNMDSFESSRLELAATDEGTYDTTLRWSEMPAAVHLTSLIAQVPFQQADYRWRNFGAAGGTLRALARWDAQKRRASLRYGAPFFGRPQIRYLLEGDARSETWNIGMPDDFRVRKWDSSFRLRFVPSARFNWETGVVVANRAFPGAPQYTGGASIKHVASAQWTLWNIPNKRWTVDTLGSLETGRLFADTGGGRYVRTQWSITSRWFPKTRGRDLETIGSLSLGSVWGAAPLDELFMLTQNRDYDLPLRGHRGSRNGKRGTAPVGRQYILANFDFYKELWKNAFITLDGGPLADLGAVWDTIAPAQRGLLVDVGLQMRIRMPIGISFVFSYARDLPGGGGSFNRFAR